MLVIAVAATLIQPVQTKPLRDDFDALTGCFAAHILVFEKDGGDRAAAMAKAKPYHERAVATMPAGTNFVEKVDTAKRTLVGVNAFMDSDPYPKVREQVADCDKRMASGK